MKNNIRYLKYRIRSQLPYTLIVTILSVLFTLSTSVSTFTYIDSSVDAYITLAPITLIICGLSFFTPFSKKLSRGAKSPLLNKGYFIDVCFSSSIQTDTEDGSMMKKCLSAK